MTATSPTSMNTARAERRIAIRAGLFGFALLLIVFPFIPNLGPVFRLFSIPSSSMSPALVPGDFIIASRASYGYGRYSFDLFELPIAGRLFQVSPPARGDVVVFRSPRGEKTFYIKRIAGLPGDHVQMIKGALWVNGQAVPRTPAPDQPDPKTHRPVSAFTERLGGTVYTIIKRDGDHGFADDTAVFDVPAERYFVLGDNRDDSADSRLAMDRGGLGTIPEDLIIGRVIASF